MLPAALQGLGLTELHQRTDRKDGDTVWSARTREGTWLRIETDSAGRLEDIKASEGQSLSPALLTRLLEAQEREQPPAARTKISAPRSLSKKMIRGSNRRACASRKLRMTVLPEPDGPITVKLPRSPWWKLKK